MHVGVLGINFKTAQLATQEAIAKGAFALIQEKSTLFPHPVVLLSTCNRTELYFSAEDIYTAQKSLLALLEKQIGPILSQSLYSYFNADCFAHLCRVASGLDSAIFMETEIIRQVKIAYSCASTRFILPKGLHYIFQKALKVAKTVRSHCLLQKGPPTLFTILWQIAASEFSDTSRLRVFLVGYSETHRRLASFLMRKGVRDLTFCTRKPESVEEQKVCGHDRLQDWNEYDLISCASDANDFLIQGTGKKKHLILDLSVPRNVDPQIKGEGISLFNIEQINSRIEKNKQWHHDKKEKAEMCLWENVERLSYLYQMKTEVCGVNTP